MDRLKDQAEIDEENKFPELEIHPFPPFLPHNARILIMGTFPPQPKRWSMKFYYPNRTNDFWFMMGLIFYGDRFALYDTENKTFRLDAIKELLCRKGIALSDTGFRIKRMTGNASDKFLNIVEPVNLKGLLSQMPECRTLATTGEKAADVLASLTDTIPPKMGCMVTDSSGIDIWRMPSTSRAYPLKLENKAAYYQKMFRNTGILQ